MHRAALKDIADQVRPPSGRRTQTRAPGEIAYDEAHEAITDLWDTLADQERREYTDYAANLTAAVQSRLAALDLPTPVTVNITLAPKTAGAAEDFDDHAPDDHRRYPSLAGCVCRKLLGKGGSDLDEPPSRRRVHLGCPVDHTAGTKVAVERHLDHDLTVT